MILSEQIPYYIQNWGQTLLNPRQKHWRGVMAYPLCLSWIKYPDKKLSLISVITALVVPVPLIQDFVICSKERGIIQNYADWVGGLVYIVFVYFVYIIIFIFIIPIKFSRLIALQKMKKDQHSRHNIMRNNPFLSPHQLSISLFIILQNEVQQDSLYSFLSWLRCIWQVDYDWRQVDRLMIN